MEVDGGTAVNHEGIKQYYISKIEELQVMYNKRQGCQSLCIGSEKQTLPNCENHLKLLNV